MSKKIILIIFIFLIAFISFTPKKIEAETLRDLYNELNELKDKKAEQDKNKNQTEQEKISTNKEIALAAQQIEECENKIIEAQDKTKELNKEIESKKDEIEKLMRGLQVSNGGNAYLEYVFKATSYTDFIYRSAIVEQLTSYNDKLIEDMYNMIEENKQLQIDMNNKTKELENLNNSLTKKLSSLNASLADITENQMSLVDLIKMQQALIEDYESYGCKMDEELNDCLDVPLGMAFFKPLKKGYVSSKFGYRYLELYGYTRFHDGVDLGGNSEGTAIYAAAPGVVSLKYAYKGCGGYRIYISHIIDGVRYTTKYLHLLKFGNVKFGDVVTPNTIIGYVGGGSGTRSYDKCSTGAHLHFSVGKGWYTVEDGSSGITWKNPMSDDFEFDFPSRGYWYSR